MQYPKKSWLATPEPDPGASEAALQEAVNDYLAGRSLRSIRIPDGVFRWVQFNAPARFRMWFNHVFGGLPDNLVLVPIPGTPYCLALCLELKTEKGRLHGRQKSEARKNNWTVARSLDEAVSAVEQAERTAQTLMQRASAVR